MGGQCRDSGAAVLRLFRSRGCTGPPHRSPPCPCCPTPPLHQSLSTIRLAPEQGALDLLTGFHLVDGKERIVVLEGLEAGAMTVVKVWGRGEEAGRAGEAFHLLPLSGGVGGIPSPPLSGGGEAFHLRP